MSARASAAMAPSPQMAEYRRHVQARYAPVVATVTTPEADAACARCGVRSFADLLRPFADVRGLNVPMRHNAEAPPYALSELSIRFHGVRELCRVAPEAAEAYARRAFEPWDGVDADALTRTLNAVTRETREILARAANETNETNETRRDARVAPSVKDDGDDIDVDRVTILENTCEGENEHALVSWFGTPWFDRFASRARKRCAFADFETVDHPRATLFVTAASTQNENENETDSEEAFTKHLIDTFVEMSAPPDVTPDSYPPAIRASVADPDVAIRFVVLHAPGDARVTEARLASVREALRKHKQQSLLKASKGTETERDRTNDAEDSIDIRVTALPIPSASVGETRGGSAAVSADATEIARLFKRSAEARLAPASETDTVKDVGDVPDEPTFRNPRPITLNDRDVETLRFFVRALATETLLPHMERRLASLNRTVAATRKGLKNQLKTFWGRNVAGVSALGGFGGSFGALANGTALGGGGVTGGSVGTASEFGASALSTRPNDASRDGSTSKSKYSFRSPTSEIRLAADLAFSLRDHETAAHHYRLLQSDFKADKAFRHLACAHESLAEALACSGAQNFRGGNSTNDGSVGSVSRESARRDIDAAFDAAVVAHRKTSETSSNTSNTNDPPRTRTTSETAAWTWRVSHSRAAFLAAVGAHRDAALAMATASGDEGVSNECAAAALEAASIAFSRVSPPMLRKFAAHAVLAGHRFAQAGFRAHAARCYASALPVYENADNADNADGPEPSFHNDSFFPDGTRVKTPWARAREHLHFALGRQIAKCGNSPAAAAHFEKLLACADGVSAAAQATYVREFLFLDASRCPDAFRDGTRHLTGEKKTDETDEAVTSRTIANASNDDTKRVVGVSLPEIDAGDVVVSFEDGDGGVFSSADASTRTCHFPEERWRALESDGVVPAHLAHASVGGATWLDAPRAGKTKGGEQFGVCAAGETVFVSSRFRNPLEIPLALTEVSLRCAFEKSGSQTSSKDVKSGDDDTSVSIPALDITLRPLETRLVRLACVPQIEGTLRVSGVSWRLRSAETPSFSETASAEEKTASTQRTRNFVPFDVRAARTRRGADGVVWVRDTPRERRLALRVTPAMPRLECRLERVPASMPAGAVAKITLVARNVAKGVTSTHPPTYPTGSCNVPDASAHPSDIATAALRVRVRAPGEGLIALADQSPGDAFESARETLERRTKTSASVGGWLFQPSAWSSIRPGEEVSLDFYVRPTVVGVAELPFVICYEPPEPAPPSLRFRVARVATRIEVTPSLEITARVFDAATHPAARVIRVAARNVSGGYPPASYTFFVRAVRLLPALERAAHSSRGANGFSNDAEPLRSLSHAVNENENHEKQKRASDLFLRPLVSGPGPDAAGETRRGVAIEPAKARDILLTAGPAEAFEDAHSRDASDVASYAAADASAELAALDRLTLVASASAAFAGANPNPKPRAPRDADKARAFESSQTRFPVGFETSRPEASAASLRDVAVEWEATDPETGARAFFGAHTLRDTRGDAFRLDSTRLDSSSTRIRWTLEGPPRGVSTIDARAGATSVSARFALRAYNPNAYAVRVTFESTCHSQSTCHDGESAVVGAATSGWTSTSVDESTRARPNTTHGSIVSLPPGRPWLWTGPVTRSFTVPSGATGTLDLVATAFAPGVFALGDYKLVVQALSGSSVVERCLLPLRDASDAPFAWTVREEA